MYCPTPMLPSHSNTLHVVCHKQTQGLHEIWKLCHDVIVRLEKEHWMNKEKALTLLSVTPFTSIYYSPQSYEVGTIFPHKKLRHVDVK